MKKVWFITGSSRGLGRSLTAAVLKSGDFVVATARSIASIRDFEERHGDQVLALALDVTNTSQISDAVAKAIGRFGRIDVLVNNAGFGITGAAEGFTDEQVRSQLDTNLYAPIQITRAILPHMRRQGAGRILQISSIGGRVGGAGLTMYQAAKFGLGGFSEALAKEVDHLGIKVTSVEPGGFRTDWAGSSMTFAQPVEGYESTVGRMQDFLKNSGYIPVGDPDKAAKVLIDLAVHENPPVHLVLGSEAIGILKQADAVRLASMEDWLSVSVSTDHDDAEDFFKSGQGQILTQLKGI